MYTAMTSVVLGDYGRHGYSYASFSSSISCRGQNINTVVLS